MLKRTVSMRRFFWVPTTYVLVLEMRKLIFWQFLRTQWNSLTIPINTRTKDFFSLELLCFPQHLTQSVCPDSILTPCMLGIFLAFVVGCWLFFKINFSKKNSFSNRIRVSTSLDPDQALCWSWFGSKLFATTKVTTCKWIVKLGS